MNDRLPEKYIKPSGRVVDMPIGVIRHIAPAAMQVDADGRCWLDPHAETIGGPEWFPLPRHHSAVQVGRSQGGFEIGYQFRQGHQWERTIVPARYADRLAFIPVVGAREAITMV